MIAAANQDNYGQLFVWCLILIAVLVVGFVLVAWVKRRMQHQDIPQSVGFTLADLRELHRSGKISDQEYEKARGKMAAALKARETRGKTENPKNPG